MYAEITIYDDNGIKKNDEPYRIPAEQIHEHTVVEPHYEIIDYEFKFVYCERIPLDQREIEIHEREHAAYEKGYKEGRDETWEHCRRDRY